MTTARQLAPAPTAARSTARALTDADLAGRTLRDLALMRNTVYARAGHAFVKAWLRDLHRSGLVARCGQDDASKIAPSIAPTSSDRRPRGRGPARRAGRAPRRPAGHPEPARPSSRVCSTSSSAAPAARPRHQGSPLEDPAARSRTLDG
jgi:hypothetical protein